MFKTYDCLNQDLLIVEVKIESSYITWDKIEYGFPQGATLGPPLFNIFMCDVLLILVTLMIILHTQGKKITANLQNL